ncbi:MAG TPA: transposase [Ideonella sp.]|uniref:transposase n=1 Tax=Ideonella sp. TaxID=1929293 RepID=UPI002CC65FE8|nr:transposase [Ideonella sp.]HSI49296.1 transposase [Ideonella sp.]
MARQARMSVAGYPHHLIQRGHNRADVFVDDADRQRYLDILRDVAHEHKVAVHAYVLMGNHAHLLATPETAEGLSRMMQSLGRRYVGWFNHRHQRTGTLWEGRFRSHLVDADAYLLSCLRYIELNPHRAGLVSGLLDHPWSSMAHHLGQRRDPLVTDHPAFWQLGNTPFEREAAYRQWLEEGISESERQRLTESLLKARPLGSPRFMQQLSQELARPLVPRPRGRPRKPTATE